MYELSNLWERANEARNDVSEGFTLEMNNSFENNFTLVSLQFDDSY